MSPDNLGDYDVQLMRYLGDTAVTMTRGDARNVIRHTNVWWFLHDLLEQADVT